MNVNTKNDDTGVIKGEFKHCKLIWENEDGSVLHYSSILPLKYCKIGKVIEINNGEKFQPWIVSVVSSDIIINPIDPRILIKHHRNATGDSMPKRGLNK